MLGSLREVLEEIYDSIVEYGSVFAQILLALVFDLGGVFAGFLLAYSLSRILNISWALALYPIVLSTRGALTGIYCGRLSTSLHIGTILPRFLRNTEEFWLLRGAMVFLLF